MDTFVKNLFIYFLIVFFSIACSGSKKKAAPTTMKSTSPVIKTEGCKALEGEKQIICIRDKNIKDACLKIATKDKSKFVLTRKKVSSKKHKL